MWTMSTQTDLVSIISRNLGRGRSKEMQAFSDHLMAGQKDGALRGPAVRGPLASCQQACCGLCSPFSVCKEIRCLFIVSVHRKDMVFALQGPAGTV